jgi:hypothetical protein
MACYGDRFTFCFLPCTWTLLLGSPVCVSVQPVVMSRGVRWGYLCRETASSGLLTAVGKVAQHLTLAPYTHTELEAKGIKFVLCGARLRARCRLLCYRLFRHHRCPRHQPHQHAFVACRTRRSLKSPGRRAGEDLSFSFGFDSHVTGTSARHRGVSPRANCTDRATAVGEVSANFCG